MMVGVTVGRTSEVVLVGVDMAVWVGAGADVGLGNGDEVTAVATVVGVDGLAVESWACTLVTTLASLVAVSAGWVGPPQPTSSNANAAGATNCNMSLAVIGSFMF